MAVVLQRAETFFLYILWSGSFCHVKILNIAFLYLKLGIYGRKMHRSGLKTFLRRYCLVFVIIVTKSVTELLEAVLHCKFCFSSCLYKLPFAHWRGVKSLRLQLANLSWDLETAALSIQRDKMVSIGSNFY